MTLPQTIDAMLARIDDLGYEIVERKDYAARTVIRFKRPQGFERWCCDDLQRRRCVG
jgi:hypothetical protein